MGTYQEQKLKAKALRDGIVEARPVGTKNQRARPVIVESRWITKGTPPRDWRKWGAYRTEAEAGAVIANGERKYSFLELRIKPKEE